MVDGGDLQETQKGLYICKNYVWLMNILLTIKMYSPISMVSVTMQVVLSPALFTADTQHRYVAPGCKELTVYDTLFKFSVAISCAPVLL